MTSTDHLLLIILIFLGKAVALLLSKMLTILLESKHITMRAMVLAKLNGTNQLGNGLYGANRQLLVGYSG
jgi:hypothetical protein